MWIQVRTMDGKVAHTVDSLSRLTKVEELRKKIQELFHVEPGLQRLFYRGKQVNSLCRLPACLPTSMLPGAHISGYSSMLGHGHQKASGNPNVLLDKGKSTHPDPHRHQA